MNISPITREFAAEITDIDLRQPLTTEDVRKIQKTIDRFGVLVFRDQSLEDEQLAQFAASFGPLHDISDFQKSKLTPGTQSSSRYVTGLSNTDDKGNLLPQDHVQREIAAGNRLWHTDGTYFNVRHTYSFLNGKVIPPVGGETEFSDLRAVYDALSPDMQETVEKLVAEHSWLHSRALTGFDTKKWEKYQDLLPPPVPRPLVHVHPGSKRKVLCLAAHIETIQGMSKQESQKFVWDLIAFASQPEFVYQHKWRTNDLLMWDNLSVMHRGRPFDDDKYPREMRTVRVQDSFELQNQESIRA